MSWGCGFISKPFWTKIQNAVPDEFPKWFKSKSDWFRPICYTFEHISKLLEHVLAVF